MTLRTVHRAQTSRRSRAATMIEFALVLPVFVFMMLFTVDLGSMMLISGAMNDNAFTAARAGAQAGGASMLPSGDRGVTYRVLAEAKDQVPMSDSMWTFDPATVSVETGDVCATAGEDVFVTVKAPFTVNLMTPGLTGALNWLNDTAAADGFSMTATGVARCEVFRNP